MSYGPLVQKLTGLREAASPRPLKAMRGLDGMMTISVYRDDDWQVVAKFVLDTTMRGADEANAALAAPAHEYAACVAALVEIVAGEECYCADHMAGGDTCSIGEAQARLADLAKALGVEVSDGD